MNTPRSCRYPHIQRSGARSSAFCALLAVTTLSCSRAPAGERAAEPLGAGKPTDSASANATAAAAQAPAPTSVARIGAVAPDFELPDLEGKPTKLSSFRGKTVVLEWFNPGCPFVQASHTKGSLVGTAARLAKKDVVWLAINSGAPGKQGHGRETNREAKERFALEHPVLLDEDGRVGRAYAATRTPHLYVIDAQGILVYRGAIDNSPDGEGESPEGGRLVNYVDNALDDLAAGRKVAVAETESYGCSVKYAQ